ncbi:S24 family peptidase [Vibrio lentus]|uniref:S24 family peptidase n=1 Tax=Vibrio lentus TaxID=136468 RepID=UPI0039AED961
MTNGSGITKTQPQIGIECSFLSSNISCRLVVVTIMDSNSFKVSRTFSYLFNTKRINKDMTFSALEVRGDSMEPVLYDGSIVFVDRI